MKDFKVFREKMKDNIILQNSFTLLNILFTVYFAIMFKFSDLFSDEFLKNLLILMSPWIVLIGSLILIISQILFFKKNVSYIRDASVILFSIPMVIFWLFIITMGIGYMTNSF
ncbi:MAG: hypothetical protein GXZ08_04890 [Tissierellia bacterium]|nr:hypothetical protein [Tissierellia bacterium]